MYQGLCLANRPARLAVASPSAAHCFQHSTDTVHFPAATAASAGLRRRAGGRRMVEDTLSMEERSRGAGADLEVQILREIVDALRDLDGSRCSSVATPL